MRRLVRAASLTAFLVALLGAPRSGTAQGGPTQLRVESYVPGIAFSSVQSLPRSPVSERSDCYQPAKKVSSAAAAEVAAAGWGVTGEVTVGRFRAVALIAGARAGTSGSCLLSQGNLAIFDGTRLLAIGYATSASKVTIGGVEQVAPDVIRLWDGDYLSQPIADIRPSNGSPVDGGTLAVLPLASEQRFCGGHAVVPNIYGMPIDVARRLLGIEKWSAMPHKPDRGDVADGREGNLVKRGILEVESCSGIGFGYCSFRYKGPAGDLQVTTVGDDDLPDVSGYRVGCGG
jgi:hypothetical protein